MVIYKMQSVLKYKFRIILGEVKSKKNTIYLAAFLLIFASLIDVTFVSAIAKESTVSISLESGSLSLSLAPTSAGAFSESGNATVSITTDNFTGYNLSITNTDNETSLINSNNRLTRFITINGGLNPANTLLHLPAWIQLLAIPTFYLHHLVRG